MSNTNSLTPERLRELLHYDPETGVFTWIAERRRKVKAGDVAGCKRTGEYIKIRIDYQLHLAHRLAWLYVHGVWPKRFIDHINCDRSDNRIANLREACDTINAQNIIAPKAHSKSGVLGVKRYERKDGRVTWRASLRHEGRTMYIGTFDSVEQASEAYVKHKRQLHVGCTL